MERYRKENGNYCIDLSFREFKQLYDSRDPSPFQDRDLDENLAHYLVMSCEEIPKDQPIKMVLSSPRFVDEVQQKNDFIAALHHYFEHEERKTDNELKFLFRQGRTSFLFGLVFLFICIFIAVRFAREQTVFSQVVYEGLIIMGWVALWKPINIFLYEWWPYLRKKRVYKILSSVPVEFKIHSLTT